MALETRQRRRIIKWNSDDDTVLFKMEKYYNKELQTTQGQGKGGDCTAKLFPERGENFLFLRLIKNSLFFDKYIVHYTTKIYIWYEITYSVVVALFKKYFSSLWMAQKQRAQQPWQKKWLNCLGFV